MNREAVEILLVEDHPADAELTLHALQDPASGGLVNQIHLARDGAEALDFLFCRGPFSGRRFDRPPRMVLLDLKLPKVDGLEVLRQVKADPRTRPIPVVILTSSDEERDRIAGYQFGVNSYIRKPVDFDQFRATVRQLGLYWLLVNHAAPGAAYSSDAGPGAGR